MSTLQGRCPRSFGRTFQFADLLKLSKGTKHKTDFVTDVHLSRPFAVSFLRGFVWESVTVLRLSDTDSSSLDVLDSFVNVDSLKIELSSPEVLLALTQRLRTILPQRLKPLKQLVLSCDDSCVFSKPAVDELLPTLREVLLGIEHASIVGLVPDLQGELALHVLPSCQSLSVLRMHVPGFDCVVPFLESDAFLTVRELHVTTEQPWTIEQANVFAQRIRATHYLRLLSCSFGSPQADTIVFTAAVETTSVLRVRCSRVITSPELMAKIYTHFGLHSRELSFEGLDAADFKDLIGHVPCHFVLPFFLSLVDEIFLKIIESDLRNPTCALRELNASLRPSCMNEDSLLSFFLTISSCSSLLRVHLDGNDIPYIQPIVAMLSEAKYLKRFECIVVEPNHNDLVTLAHAVAGNEVLERILICSYMHFTGVLGSLGEAVEVRNVAMCVRRCRLMFLSWMLDRQCSEGELFDAAVVYDVLVSAELDWAENQRSAAESWALAEVAADMPTKLEYTLRAEEQQPQEQDNKRSEPCAVL